MRISTVLFDFDGTVADTNGLVMDSWQHTYRVLTGSYGDESLIRATFGEPLGISMEKAFPDTPVERAIGLYRAHQQDIFEEMIRPFPGMCDLIRTLKAQGFRTGVVTSRMRRSTVIGLEKFGLMDVIDCLVTCEDTDRHKPDPAPVLIALEKLGASAEESLMVGDSLFDIRCAHNAGVAAVLVGFSEAVNAEELSEPDRPEHMIETAEALLEILKRP